QRREVCVPRDNGEYWIVPWESVTAAATQCSSISQAGRVTVGLLLIGFENPDAEASEDHKHFSMGFNCGGGETAMALWETEHPDSTAQKAYGRPTLMMFSRLQGEKAGF
ncbi:hypothetical protein A258_07937, partial [Pseudomonas syringae pv. actinidiae ICMP 19104]